MNETGPDRLLSHEPEPEPTRPPVSTMGRVSGGTPEGTAGVSSGVMWTGTTTVIGVAPMVPGREKLGLLLTVGLLAAGWYHTFVEMWMRWFPAWRIKTMPLMERLTEGDSYYTHGPIVPLTSLVIAFFVYKRVGVPARRSVWASALGWVLLLGCLCLHLMSVSPGARVMFVSGFALIGVIGGLVLIWGGWPLAGAYWLPVVFLLFMVPLPEVAIVNLNFRLKFIAGRAALWVTNHVFGVPAVMDGSYVHLMPDENGVPKTLVVENVCSGLRSLISLIWFASLFAMICRVKGLWRLVMLAMAVPVAIACNTVRISSLNLVAHYFSVEDAGPGSTFHDMSGLLIFAVALAILFGLEQAVILLGRLFRRDWTDMRLLGFLDRVSGARVGSLGVLRPMPMGVLVLGAGLSLFWTTRSVAMDLGKVAHQGAPKTLLIDGQTFVGEDQALDEKSLIILETNDYLYRRFTHQETGRTFDLLIVFSANNRKGTHPPEVCIEGGGDQIVGKRLQRVTAEAVGDVWLSELLAQRGRRMTYFLYLYKCGRRYTPNFLAQQFWIFANGLSHGNTSGALIRISLPADPLDIESARRTALAATEALMPEIDRRLP